MELCEKHGKNKEIFCSQKECMIAICLKCMRDHSAHGQNLLNIEDMIEEIQQKQQSSLSKLTTFNSMLSNKLKENTAILTKFDDKTSIFTETIEKQMKLFIEHVSKSLKDKKIQFQTKKNILSQSVSDSVKALANSNYLIETLTKEMDKVNEAISTKKYEYLFIKNMESKDYSQNFEKLADEPIFILNDLRDPECDARQFLVDQFMNFSPSDQYKSQLKNEADIELQETLKKIQQAKMEYIILEEKLNNHKREIVEEEKKFNEKKQKFYTDPSTYFSNLENSICSNFEKTQKIFFEKYEKFEETQSEIKKSMSLYVSGIRSSGLSFNKNFMNLDFSENGLICGNQGNETRHCLSSQTINAKSNSKIKILFTPGNGCSNANFGLIEEFNFNVSSNKNRINEVEKSKEVFYVARDGETSSNLTGLKQKIEKTTEFNIHIKFGELFIDSDNGLTKLTGKLTKNSYYFGVSPCCRGASFQILKFWEE